MARKHPGNLRPGEPETCTFLGAVIVFLEGLVVQETTRNSKVTGQNPSHVSLQVSSKGAWGSQQKPPPWEACTPQGRGAPAGRNEDPTQPKINKI